METLSGAKFKPLRDHNCRLRRFCSKTIKMWPKNVYLIGTLSFQINVTMTRKMKNTEKHSQLNEFAWASRSKAEVLFRSGQ